MGPIWAATSGQVSPAGRSEPGARAGRAGLKGVVLAALLAVENYPWVNELVEGRSIPLQTAFMPALLAVLGSALSPVRRFAPAGLIRV